MLLLVMIGGQETWRKSVYQIHHIQISLIDKSWDDFIRKVKNEGGGKCHRVKAIKIDFVFIKRFFIYDYY